ncbi:MAG: hypothetical protein A2V64_08270 [Bacteroidetes bacterium RBG_13_43_22]|nr:MAG: hypothetical protein A2V64_08270 [Bacteroidetes bacterium RBG_13_43_22]
MNRLSSTKCLLVAFAFFLSAVICSAGPEINGSVTGSVNEIPEALPRQKKVKVKKPMSAEKAQKQADAKDKQRRRESDKYIKENRKRSIEIQSPEVQERMKQNVKDANARYKVKKKTNTSRAKKAGRKYR